jgi:hypothetical protein
VPTAPAAIAWEVADATSIVASFSEGRPLCSASAIASSHGPKSAGLVRLFEVGRGRRAVFRAVPSSAPRRAWSAHGRLVFSAKGGRRPRQPRVEFVFSPDQSAALSGPAQ